MSLLALMASRSVLNRLGNAIIGLTAKMVPMNICVMCLALITSNVLQEQYIAFGHPKNVMDLLIVTMAVMKITANSNKLQIVINLVSTRTDGLLSIGTKKNTKLKTPI